MTYQELKDRLSKCEYTLTCIKDGSSKIKDTKTVRKLELLKESLKTQLKEMDVNDPVMMKLRSLKAKIGRNKASSKSGSEKGLNPWGRAVLIKKLKLKRDQVMRDMEQEAEPEGGPIADKYGDMLNKIDAALEKAKGTNPKSYDDTFNEGNEEAITYFQQAIKLSHTNKVRNLILKAAKELGLEIPKVWTETVKEGWNDRNDIFSLGYDLDATEYLIDYLKSKYKEGVDYELHIGRGDTHPNAITLINPEMEQDKELGNLLMAAGDNEETDYQSGREAENDYTDVKSFDETKEAPAGHYFTKSGNLVKGTMSADAKEKGARKSDPKDKTRSKVPKATQYKEGLWANINAKKKAGKKSSHGNSNAHKDAVKAGNKLKEDLSPRFIKKYLSMGAPEVFQDIEDIESYSDRDKAILIFLDDQHGITLSDKLAKGIKDKSPADIIKYFKDEDYEYMSYGVMSKQLGVPVVTTMTWDEAGSKGFNSWFYDTKTLTKLNKVFRTKYPELDIPRFNKLYKNYDIRDEVAKELDDYYRGEARKQKGIDLEVPYEEYADMYVQALKDKKALDKSLKEQDRAHKLSKNEISLIAHEAGKAVISAILKSGDEISSAKIKDIYASSLSGNSPEAFTVHIIYKNDKEDGYRFQIQDDKLYFLAPNNKNIIISDVGIKPSGEAVINKELIKNEMLKYFNNLNELENKGMVVTKDSDEAEKLAKKGVNVKLTTEGPHQTTYIKVAQRDYRKAMAIIDRAIDTEYVTTDIVDDDGDGNVIVYFNFTPATTDHDRYNPDTDPAEFIYDLSMDLQSRDVQVVAASHDLDETMTDKEFTNAQEHDRLQDHPERDKILAIQQLIAKEKKLKEDKYDDMVATDKDIPLDKKKGAAKALRMVDKGASFDKVRKHISEESEIDKVIKAKKMVKDLAPEMNKLPHMNIRRVSFIKHVKQINQKYKELLAKQDDKIAGTGRDQELDEGRGDFDDVLKAIQNMSNNDDISERDAAAEIVLALADKFQLPVDKNIEDYMEEAASAVKVGDILSKDGKKGKVTKISDTQATVDFGNGDVYGIAHSRIKGNEIVKEGDGLWANIRAKRARGEKPAHKNSNAHKDAVKAGKKINKTNEYGSSQGARELETLFGALGYDEFDDFIEDNPGAVEALHGWISSIPEFRKKLGAEFSNSELEDMGMYDIAGYDDDDNMDEKMDIYHKQNWNDDPKEKEARKNNKDRKKIYKDTLDVDEANNLLKQDALSPAEYQNAKKLKGFDSKNYKWDKDQELHLIRKMNEDLDVDEAEAKPMPDTILRGYNANVKNAQSMASALLSLFNQINDKEPADFTANGNIKRVLKLLNYVAKAPDTETQEPQQEIDTKAARASLDKFAAREKELDRQNPNRHKEAGAKAAAARDAARAAKKKSRNNTARSTSFYNKEEKIKEAGPGFAHDCAAKVVHETYGVGICIPEKHTLIKEGNKYVVTHYDVVFKEGKKVVKDIPVSELEIKTSNEHWHKGYKKKKK